MKRIESDVAKWKFFLVRFCFHIAATISHKNFAIKLRIRTESANVLVWIQNFNSVSRLNVRRSHCAWTFFRNTKSHRLSIILFETDLFEIQNNISHVLKNVWD